MRKDTVALKVNVTCELPRNGLVDSLNRAAGGASVDLSQVFKISTSNPLDGIQEMLDYADKTSMALREQYKTGAVYTSISQGSRTFPLDHRGDGVDITAARIAQELMPQA